MTAHSLTKFAKPLRTSSISDIHIGTPRIPMVDICNHLENFFFPKVVESDFVVLGGDIYDSLLSFSAETTNPVISNHIDLLKLCDKHNVVLRVLRGTYDHDRDQLGLFKTLYAKGGCTHNFRYIDTVTIEYIEELGIRVLYIPDSLPYKSSEECMTYVHKLMADMGWKTVDYAVVHGNFQHRYPPGIPLPKVTFRWEQFKDIVTRYVLCGHIHVPDFYENVLYNGSFERTVHGEEENKGFIYLVDDGIEARINFIVNEDTTPFITFDLTKYSDPSEVIEQYEKRMRKHRYDRVWYVRIKHNSSEIRKILMNYTKQKYPNVRFSALIETQTSTAILDTKELLEMSNLPKPTPDLLPQMVYERVALADPMMTLEDVTDLLERL